MKCHLRATVFMVLHVASAQKVGSLKTENHPKLNVAECTADGCMSVAKEVVIDANWRWIHNGAATNCFDNEEWDDSFCSDPASCDRNCVMEGADDDYDHTYGVQTSDDELKLSFVTQGPHSRNVGSRMCLLEDE